MDNTKKKGGRNPKSNPSNRRYVFYLTEDEGVRMTGLFRQSGMKRISGFLKNVLLDKPIKVVKIDKATMDFYMRLTTFYNQFQAVGVNYNQIVKALKTNFSEKRAVVLLRQLEKATFEMVALNRQIIQLTHDFEAKHLT